MTDHVQLSELVAALEARVSSLGYASETELLRALEAERDELVSFMHKTLELTAAFRPRYVLSVVWVCVWVCSVWGPYGGT